MPLISRQKFVVQLPPVVLSEPVKPKTEPVKPKAGIKKSKALDLESEGEDVPVRTTSNKNCARQRLGMFNNCAVCEDCNKDIFKVCPVKWK